MRANCDLDHAESDICSTKKSTEMKMNFITTSILAIMAALTAASPLAQAQVGNATITTVQNGSTIDVSVFIQRLGQTAWNMGTSSFVFNYNASAMTFDSVQVKGPWDASTTALYGPMLSALYGNGTAQSVETDNVTTGSGNDVPVNVNLVATLRFSITNLTASTNITWNAGYSAFHDATGALVNVTMTNPSDDPLPIQLSSFVASVAGGGHAALNWTTVSEINNYGFGVQKAVNNATAFQDISGGFIAGNGTTTVKHNYSYVDTAYAAGNVYRLKQLGLDGTANFSAAVAPLGVTSVAAPNAYSLSQNYPNPFNPTTHISYVTTKEGPVTLRIYDILGREVATLVNENRKPGQHTERFDGSKVASGMYVFVLRSSEGQRSNRMILSK